MICTWEPAARLDGVVSCRASAGGGQWAMSSSCRTISNGWRRWCWAIALSSNRRRASVVPPPKTSSRKSSTRCRSMSLEVPHMPATVCRAPGAPCCRHSPSCPVSRHSPRGVDHHGQRDELLRHQQHHVAGVRQHAQPAGKYRQTHRAAGLYLFALRSDLSPALPAGSRIVLAARA